ncbi:MAG: regulatory protein RecX [Clostridium sp.]
MTVDRIEPLDKRRCKVFLDGDFAFVLYKGELKKFYIEEGTEMTDEVYQEILKVICKRVRERALYILKFSNRTEAELRIKLRMAFYPEAAIDEAVRFLREYHYLDDDRYAKNYIEVYGKRKSRAELMNALLKKGVEKSCIVQLLEEQPPDEEQQIRQWLEKRRYKDDARPEEKRKTIAFLMRKGFSYALVRRVIGDIDEDEITF